MVVLLFEFAFHFARFEDKSEMSAHTRAIWRFCSFIFFFACFHTFIYTSHHKMNRIDMNILFERYIQCFNHKVNKLVSLGRAIRTLVAYSTTFGISITVCVNEFFVNFLRETTLYWWKRMSGDSGVFHKCSLLEMFWIFECWNINSWILATRTHKYTRILSHVNRIQFCRNIKKRKKSKSNSFNSLLKHWFLCFVTLTSSTLNLLLKR